MGNAEDDLTRLGVGEGMRKKVGKKKRQIEKEGKSCEIARRRNEGKEEDVDGRDNFAEVERRERNARASRRINLNIDMTLPSRPCSAERR